jgi:hypothetical protein
VIAATDAMNRPFKDALNLAATSGHLRGDRVRFPI